MNTRKLLKNNIIIFLLSFIIQLTVFLFFSKWTVADAFYIYPGIGLTSIFGLIFGPYGALGGALASGVGDYIIEANLTVSVCDFIIMLIVAYVPFKLWYTIMDKDGLSTPKFNSTYNVMKFFIVITISGIIYFILLGLYIEGIYGVNGIVDGVYLNTINYFDFGILWGFLLIILFNLFNVPFYKPKTSVFKQNKLPVKVFDILFTIILIWGLLDLIVFNSSSPSYNLLILSIAFIIGLLYLLRPYSPKADMLKENLNHSIIEKIILVLIIVSISILVIVLFLAYNDFFKGFYVVRADTMVLIYSFSAYLLFFLPSLYFLRFLEHDVTKPIGKLADTTSNYVEGDELADSACIIKEYNPYITKNNEFSDLSSSFTRMVKDLDTYMINLEKATAERERYETELDLAEDIQLSMLPTNFNEISEDKNFSIFANMSPAREVGGDFYNYFLLDEDHLVLSIGDVSGKGIPGSLFMVKAMNLVENSVKYYNNLSDAVFNLNNTLCNRNNGELFVTCFISILELSTGKLTFVNAGHNPPLLKKEDNDFEYLDYEPDLILAAMEDVTYNEFTIQLSKNDILFLYTDGITEANNNYKTFYGESNLRNLLNNNKNINLEQFYKLINEDIKHVIGDVEQYDDETMLVLKFE